MVTRISIQLLPMFRSMLAFQKGREMGPLKRYVGCRLLPSATSKPNWWGESYQEEIGTLGRWNGSVPRDTVPPKPEQQQRKPATLTSSLLASVRFVQRP